MKSKRLLLVCTLLIILLSVAFFVQAVCNPADTGTAGNDTIVCDVANQPAGDVEGQDGDDVIVIDSGVTTAVDISGGNNAAAAESGNDTIIIDGVVTGTVHGDTFNGFGTGNDVIIVNGSATIIYGDSDLGGAIGNDIIINNGTVGSIHADNVNSGGIGNDTIVNNGTANGFIQAGNGSDTITNNGNAGNGLYGDSPFSGGNGSDTITNNGNVVGGIYGDAMAGVGLGDDTIINNGTTDDIYGDNLLSVPGTGDDTITNNGTVTGTINGVGGNDTVIIGTNTAQVGGVIDGGADYDVLTFNITSTDPAVLLDAAAQIAAANPAGGTITLAGHTYTWANFEELTQLLFSLARINGLMDPLAVFCSLTGGVDVYAISGSQGSLVLSIGAQQISNGVAAAAVASGNSVQIGSSGTATVYVTATGDVEVIGTGGFNFSFVYQNYCGSLPTANDEPVVTQEEEELPPFTIVNQPYEG